MEMTAGSPYTLDTYIRVSTGTTIESGRQGGGSPAPPSPGFASAFIGSNCTQNQMGRHNEPYECGDRRTDPRMTSHPQAALTTRSPMLCRNRRRLPCLDLEQLSRLLLRGGVLGHGPNHSEPDQPIGSRRSAWACHARLRRQRAMIPTSPTRPARSWRAHGPQAAGGHHGFAVQARQPNRRNGNGSFVPFTHVCVGLPKYDGLIRQGAAPANLHPWRTGAECNRTLSTHDTPT